METFTITHTTGRVAEIEARDVLDAVFTYRGDYKTITSIVKKPKVKIEPVPQIKYEGW